MGRLGDRLYKAQGECTAQPCPCRKARATMPGYTTAKLTPTGRINPCPLFRPWDVGQLHSQLIAIENYLRN